MPPTGAKGLNLAAADVRVLARALDEFFRNGSTARLDRYSDVCLQRVWKGVRYSKAVFKKGDTLKDNKYAAVQNSGMTVARGTLTAWESYAQTLLCSNEFVYVY